MFKFVSLIFLVSLSAAAKDYCNIFIHGYTANSTNYFGDLPRQVIWDSSKDIEDSAPDVASKILEKMQSCKSDQLITLRPHSYGASQVFYILGLGKRFKNLYPDHDFVKVYKKTFNVFSYTGAYHGTPLMNLVCSNGLTRFLGRVFGKSCVRTLLTSSSKDVTSYVNSPGVPTYLIYSSNRSGYYGTIGALISKYLVGGFQYIFRGRRNQNDNTLPISSTRACAKVKAMYSRDSNCKKIDPNYFIDFYHERDRNHTGFLKDKEFMLMENSNEV